MEILEPFGVNLWRARKAQGMTQEALADACDMHRTTISLLELSKRDPHLSTIVKLARALDTTPIELVRDVGATPCHAEGPRGATPGSADPG
jgi:transcriptional regulator with XRE-family HTH domain